MARIVAAGPKDTLYAAVGSGFLVIKEPGVYALNARFERPAGPPASCLIRLGFGPVRLVSNVELDLLNSVSKVFNVNRFDLKPGLYSFVWGFGCWHEHDMVGQGRVTVLVGHPGEGTLQPARSGEIFQ